MFLQLVTMELPLKKGVLMGNGNGGDNIDPTDPKEVDSEEANADSEE